MQSSGRQIARPTVAEHATVYADDFEAGQRIPLGCRFVSEEEIVEFARKWDPFPFHLDRDAAAKSEFGGLVGSGLHVLAILQVLEFEAVLHRTAMVAGLGFDEMRLHAPAYAGDTLTGSMVIRTVRMRADGRAVVTWQGLLDRGDTRVLSMEGAAMIRQRPTFPEVPDDAGRSE
ncbi:MULTISPECIES: MaoC/PaaZ C-terminal domain-containing protein [unclassified Rhodococcus (in: high G+C Gram-positive bacteria)]|uniref:MaoC/PaaZ C-terminal domain-containing protein n=1 Tax=unclassified Rhodococcus (in: high G+C Gram-positive bacteria) TaxID=192944 RepID=UPI001639BF7E|nr:MULTISPECIES: MaoC/PaaZ C-terminal domain-containing protein [unclassified Rhodococcus (in: high G+C Gram-positive bacteria)]MBC2640407.1 dehydratase [Rhodococcus sp. 3A]MBC2894847.1 dehydratase [Rhodococcus sp. 4CII]